MAKYGRGSSVPQQPYLKALQGPETRSTKDWVKMIHIETVLINTKLSQVGERNGLKNRDGHYSSSNCARQGMDSGGGVDISIAVV